MQHEPTSGQPEPADLLDLLARQEAVTARRHPNTVAFLAFHRENPAVYAALLRFTREAQAAGLQKVGIGTLMGRVRWYLGIETRSADDFKLNDHHGPYYARLIMDRHEELAGMFELREAIADGDAWLAVAA